MFARLEVAQWGLLGAVGRAPERGVELAIVTYSPNAPDGVASLFSDRILIQLR
jgi:hypothetical protein